MRLTPYTRTALFIGLTSLTGTSFAETSVEALEERVKRLEQVIQAAGLNLPENQKTGDAGANTSARVANTQDNAQVGDAPKADFSSQSAAGELAEERNDGRAERVADTTKTGNETQTPEADFSQEPTARELADDTSTAQADFTPIDSEGKDNPLEFRIGEHTTADIGGYVKVNYLYNKFSNGDSTDRQRELYTPSRVNVGSGPGSEAVDFSARWTRINLLTNTQLGGHELESFVEFDFFGAENSESTTNSFGMRLRDAFFELDDTYLFGQTDSVFMDVSAFPETLDQIGPSESISLIRQAQIRYMGENWSISLENPSVTDEFFDRNGSFSQVTQQEEDWPDLVGDYRWQHRYGHVAIGALARRISNEGVDDPRTNEPFEDDATIGYGFRFSGRFKIGDNGDDLRYFSTYGDGLGRYVALGLIPAARLDENGNVDPISYASGYLAYKHIWADTWRSNLVVGTLQVDNDDPRDFGPNDGATKNATSVHINLIWNPITPLSIGGEYLYAEREIESGADGHLDRLQFSAKYAF